MGSSSEQVELEFDFDELMGNKFLPWDKKCKEFFNLRRFYKKTLDLLVEFYLFCLEEEYFFRKYLTMNFLRIKDQKILYSYLKQNLG